MHRGIGGCLWATWASGFVGVHGLPELPRATFVGVQEVPRGVTSYADALWLFLSRLGVQQLALGCPTASKGVHEPGANSTNPGNRDLELEGAVGDLALLARGWV
jgi:hypothetical protein